MFKNEEEEEYKKGNLIKPIDSKPTSTISILDERMPMTYNSVNFKDKDTEKMNSNKAMTGENEEYKVPITGMKSSSSYFNLGMALRGQMEKKAKSQGFESLSDRTSKMKSERKEGRSLKREEKARRKQYKAK